MRSFCLVVAALVAFSCSTDAPPATKTSTGKALATALPDGNGLEWVKKINPRLYRGAQPSQDGYKELKRNGFRTVISLRYRTSAKEEAEAAGLEYISIPIHADVGSSAPTDEQIKLFFKTVLDPSKQPVYFHCKHGKDRTGTMAALYRIEMDGWTNDEAIEELHAFGYHKIFVDLIQCVRDYKPRGIAKQTGFPKPK